MAAQEQQRADMHLAFRSEGQMQNAYIEGKAGEPFVELVGSINTAMCEADPLIWATWRNLITFAVCRKAERMSGEPTQIIGRRTVPAGGSA